MRKCLDCTQGAVQTARLPCDAPDLYPAGFLSARPEPHALAQVCARSLAELKTTARTKPRRGGDVMDCVNVN